MVESTAPIYLTSVRQVAGVRNQRKLLVVDGQVGFMRPRNLDEPGCNKPQSKNHAAGRAWFELMVQVRARGTTRRRSADGCRARRCGRPRSRRRCGSGRAPGSPGSVEGTSTRSFAAPWRSRPVASWSRPDDPHVAGGRCVPPYPGEWEVSRSCRRDRCWGWPCCTASTWRSGRRPAGACARGPVIAAASR